MPVRIRWGRELVAAAVLAVATLLPSAAAASDVCWIDPHTGRLLCAASGGLPGLDPVLPPPPEGTPGPLRYLRLGWDGGAGRCWYWSRRPPGLDSWDPANDAAIIATRAAFPQCPATGSGPSPGVAATAWSVFRAFPLARPVLRLEPSAHGVTGLPTYASVVPPRALRHAETLPDGTLLEVEARVEQVTVDWGDGTLDTYAPAAVRPYPSGAARHAYAAKTCPPSYRVGHPAGPRCHPQRRFYEVRVSFTWSGRYRHGGGWIELGSLDRGTEHRYDVDEVVGVLEPLPGQSSGSTTR